MATKTQSAVPQTFGAKPKLSSDEDLARAIQFLRWATSRIVAVQQELELAQAQLRERFAGRLSINVDGQAVALDAYAAAVEKATIIYGERNEKRLFKNGELKTFTLPGGQLARHVSSSSSVVFEEADAKETDVVEGIIAGLRVKSKLAEVREKLAPFVAVRTTLDRQGIKAGCKAGTVTDDALCRHGLKLEQPVKVKVILDERPEQTNVRAA